MAKKMLIDATHAEETRVVVVDGNKVEEFDFEPESRRQLVGNIYLAKVSRVEPSLQAVFVEYGGNRHGFLAFTEIHPDYYQIPVADREALLAEEAAYAEQQQEEEDKPKSRSRSRSRHRSRSRSEAETVRIEDAVETMEVARDDIPGMGVVDLSDDEAGEKHREGTLPIDYVRETPVEMPPAETVKADAYAPGVEATAEPEVDETNGDRDRATDASERDESIESVAGEDMAGDIHPPRMPRPRRYKIQEVIKVRQILLAQVVKEERGNKGAALTTYLSLAGRYCVLMPNTARGGGISRKVTNTPDRKKLKEIANEIDVPKGAGLIIRTASAQRTKSEIKRDYEYLQRLWEQIRALTLKSTAPAKIYEEGDLIKRSIRDLYNKDIDEVFVEGKAGYRVAKDFMKMIMPSHAKNVKQYTEDMPLFARYQVESYLSSMFNPTVQLRSGGYIVIGVTEALVAIDVNSGRATREGSIEETALKTNLEAAEEVARQLRLRDLAGLIVIDFIDMKERRNNSAVEKHFNDKLKTDCARIQIGRISGFGLMEMSRQRLRLGMIETTTQPCPSCHGTGMIRSDDNLALNILRQLEEEGTRRKSREVLLKAPISIVNFLVNNKREHIAQIEARYGMSVRVEADPFLISPDSSIEKFKTAARTVPEAPVVSVNASLMADIDDEDETGVDELEAAEVTGLEGSDNGAPKKRRRRRRRGGGNGKGSEDRQPAAASGRAEGEATEEATTDTGLFEVPEHSETAEDRPPRKRMRSRSRSKKTETVEAEKAVTEDAAATSEVAEEVAFKSVEEAAPESVGAKAAPEEKPARPKRVRKPYIRSKKKTGEPVEEPVAEVVPETGPTPEPMADVAARTEAEPESGKEPAMAKAEADDKPKKRGWWSLGR